MQVKWLLKDVEFVIVPVVNPDGYVVRNVTNCIRVHVLLDYIAYFIHFE